jgi:hypothetical protein
MVAEEFSKTKFYCDVCKHHHIPNAPCGFGKAFAECYACECTQTFLGATSKKKSYFNEALALIQAMHDKKVHDYASNDNEFSNFETSAAFAGTSVHDSFNVLLGIKQARLLELTKSGKEPKNESILDTYLDRAVYSIIAYAYELKRQESK